MLLLRLAVSNVDERYKAGTHITCAPKQECDLRSHEGLGAEPLSLAQLLLRVSNYCATVRDAALRVGEDINALAELISCRMRDNNL